MNEGQKIVTGISGVEHAVHAVLTLLTGGCWLVVWVTRAISQRRVSRVK